MPESAWEKQYHGIFHFLKWPLAVLLIVLAAAVVFYNNRESANSRPFPNEIKTPVPEKQAEQAQKEAPAPVPQASLQVQSKKAGRQDVPQSGEKVRVPAAAGMAASGPDSVDLGNLACGVPDRSDIVVRLAVTVYCDALMKREVLLGRDALSAVAGKALRTADLATLKKEAVKPVLLRSMQELFGNKAITGVAVRSVAVEKVSRQ